MCLGIGPLHATQHRRRWVASNPEHLCVCMWSVTARTQLVRWSGRRSEWCHTLPEAVRRPIRQRVRDPPQVGSPCSPLRTLSRLHAGGVDLGCDPASWFSVADASMGKDGRPDLHSVPTHARRRDVSTVCMQSFEICRSRACRVVACVNHWPRGRTHACVTQELALTG